MDMTRPYKLLTAETENCVTDIVRKYTPENSIRYKIYKIVNESKKPLLLNDIIKKGNMFSTRRVYERAITDLYINKRIKRVKCHCGNAYIYSSK